MHSDVITVLILMMLWDSLSFLPNIFAGGIAGGTENLLV
jgi:hypothetical protein